MKVIHVNYSGSGGGAAIAALRISDSVNKLTSAESSLWCIHRPSNVAGCICFRNFISGPINALKNRLVAKVLKKGGEFSVNVFPSSFIRKLNKSDADIIHLHWINGELFSIEQLAHLKKPIVWTFHDMWPFCGGEHYSLNQRFITGYRTSDLISQEALRNTRKSLFNRMDLSRWVYRRKKIAWSDIKFHIICPSSWLADCVKKSDLMGNLPITVIPNCVNLDLFKPLNLARKVTLRQKFNLPTNKKLVLFGAVYAGIDRKGGDLLISALEQLNDVDSYALVVFGRSSNEHVAGIETHWVGSIFDETVMAELYNTADVMCVPSIQDNLPNTAVEASACGLPIVAFNVGGIPDIVEHRRTGYLAEPFSVKDFSAGVRWVLDESRNDELGNCARKKAEDTFSGSRVSEMYKLIYDNVISRR